MQQTGEYRIAAAREKVWLALNDPDVLAQCIEGCQGMTRVADDAFTTAIKAKVGPVSATFNADLNLTNLNPPSSYTLNGSVKGGAAGFGKGAAHVTLSDDGDATILRYQVDASVGGKLAQIGSRLIDGAARKMADDFFRKFSERVAPGQVEQGAAAPVAAKEEYESSNQYIIWIIVFGILALAIVLAL